MIEIPQPKEIPKKERDDAMGAYLMMFATFAIGLPFPIFNLIASIIYYVVNKKKSQFVKFHALQSLLSQIPTTLLNAASIFWFIFIVVEDQNFTQEFIIFISLVALLNFIYFIISVIATYYANKGRMYYFIGIGQIAFRNSFEKELKESNTEFENKPPRYFK